MKKLLLILLFLASLISCGEVLVEANRENWGPDYNQLTFSDIKSFDSKINSRFYPFPIRKDAVFILRGSNPGYYIKILVTQDLKMGFNFLYKYTTYNSIGDIYLNTSNFMNPNTAVDLDGDSTTDLTLNSSDLFITGLALYLPE